MTTPAIPQPVAERRLGEDTALHGTGQVESYRHVPYLQQKMPEPHVHNDVELNFIASGSATYLLSDQRWTLSEGYFYLFWAAVPHQLLHVEPDTHYFAIHLPLWYFLHWQLPEQFVKLVLSGTPVSTPDQTDAALHHLLFNRWHEQTKMDQPEYLHIALLEIEASLRQLALRARPSATPSVESTACPSIAPVERMIGYIKANYRDPITVGEIAESANLHPNYAMQLFRQYTGHTIVGYLNQYRTVDAQRILLTTSKSVLEVAYESGFGSLSRFYVVFKQNCGLSPKRYRQMLQLGESKAKTTTVRRKYHGR